MGISEKRHQERNGPFDFIERRPLPCNFLDTFQNGDLAVGEVIDNNGFVTRDN